MALHGESHPRGLDVSIVYPFFTRTDILNSAAYGNPPVKTMPGFFIEDPDKIIRSVLDGVAAKKLHIFPGNYSRLLWNASKFYPLIVPRMKAPWRKGVINNGY
jgi:short-subunit dehydrogenase